MIVQVGSALSYALADRCLARTNVGRSRARRRSRPIAPTTWTRPSRATERAHGPFDDRAKPRSLQLLRTKRKRPLLAAAMGGAGLAAAGALARSR